MKGNTQMRILNVVTQKGGTGKSETVKNLAYGIAQKGYKVLVIDLDPQANTSAIFLNLHQEMSDVVLDDMKSCIEQIQSQYSSSGINLSTGQIGIDVLHEYIKKQNTDYDVSDVLLNEELIDKAIRSTEYTNIDILPASIKLIQTDRALKDSVGADVRLNKALREHMTHQYDYCIIDNSPVTNALTINGIVACQTNEDIIILPVKIDAGGLEGMDITFQKMKEIKSYQYLDYDFKILFTMRNRTKVEARVEETIRMLFKNHCFNTNIRYQPSPIVNSSTKGKILLEMFKDKNVSKDYMHLVDEIVNK